jgi:hypothetical protein
VGGLLLFLASKVAQAQLMSFGKEVPPVPGRKRLWP